MSEMRKSADGGRQRTASAAPADEAPWLDNLTVCNSEGELWGWTNRWKRKTTPQFTLVIIPTLCLAQRPVHQLVHVRAYADVFKGCFLQGEGVDEARFNVLGATFPFYRTGRSAIDQMILTLEGSTGDLSKIIQLGTALLT
jgi:hypothetical protein